MVRRSICSIVCIIWFIYVCNGAVIKRYLLKRIMEKHGVVPDVIDEGPGAVIQVKFPSGVEANQGAELTPTQVKDLPSVSWEADPDSLYTLIHVDPDAPSRLQPLFREIAHWIVGNIPGNDVARGETLVSYIGSGAPQGTGLHRYIFLVYKQPGRLDFGDAGVSSENRRNFNARKFVAKYNLGKPIAGNLYQAQWDPYVDERRKAMQPKQ